MSRITRTALVTYSTEQMFALVSDIESYPEFLPGCVGSRILREEGGLVEASLELSKGGMTHRFTTRNQLTPGESIAMQLLEGPFKYLKGMWTFQALGDEGCKITLDIEFEMSNAITQMTVGAVFSQMVGSMVDAFSQRAKQIYG